MRSHHNASCTVVYRKVNYYIMLAVKKIFMLLMTLIILCFYLTFQEWTEARR